jgi:N-hydroxyarylamine O-acetyltransferase
VSRVALDAYLERIDSTGPVRRDLATLTAIHRAHLNAIPYENLEIQLGRENRLDEDAFVAKLVHGRRGGWCYEMNGLLTLALREIGFDVIRVGGAVARDALGDASIGNHMVGLVDLDRRYVVDVGLGDCATRPISHCAMAHSSSAN